MKTIFAAAFLLVSILFAKSSSLLANSCNCSAAVCSKFKNTVAESNVSPVSNVKFETDPDIVLIPGIHF